jgi:hypothetical protein
MIQQSVVGNHERNTPSTGSSLSNVNLALRGVSRDDAVPNLWRLCQYCPKRIVELLLESGRYAIRIAGAHQ